MLRSILASLIAGLGVPFLTTLAISWGHWGELTLFEWRAGFLIIGPFTMLGAFAVAWPSYVLQRKDRPEIAKITNGLFICAAVGTIMVLPLSDRFPWEGAIFGVATFLLWIAAYRCLGLSVSGLNNVRSEPSG